MLDDASSLDEIDLFVERTFVQLFIRGKEGETAVSVHHPNVTLFSITDFSMITEKGILIYFQHPPQ
jgi:hypothetical protein